MSFNEKQKEVIKCGDIPLQVISCAGSGKSTVLVAKTVKMIKDGKGDICCITFTRSTKNDLEKKFKALGLNKKITIGTFHSICGDILRKEGYLIGKTLKKFEIENIFKKIITDGKPIDSDGILSFISYQKNNMISYEDEFVYKDCTNYEEEILRKCFKAYEEEKEKRGAYDFDDYLLLGYKVLKETKNKYIFNYLLLDEGQDSNEIQFKIVDLLCPSKNITIVGDMSQCMYSFRGSKPELFMNFYDNHKNTKVVNMNINYRSDKKIVERSNFFIKQYYGDFKYYKDAIPNSEEEGYIELIKNFNKDEESVNVVDKVETLLGLGMLPSQIAILYRNNIQSQHIENELKLRNIDYFIESEGGFFNRKEVDIIMCILRIIDNKTDDSAFETLFKYRCEPFKFLSNDLLHDIISLSSQDKISHLEASLKVHALPWQKKNLNWFSQVINRLIIKNKNGADLKSIINNIIETFKLEEYIASNYPSEEDKQERLESLENLKKFIRNNTLISFLKFVYEKNTSSQKKNNENKVQLMTIHKSKGLQWKAVFVVGIEQGKFPSVKSDINEEANVFYVATTRPENRLYLSQIGESNLFCKQYFGERKYSQLLSEQL